MAKKLTVKQRKWIKEYIKTGNGTEAAWRAYDCKNREVAGAIATENLQKLSIAELMEEMGLTDVALMNMGIEGAQEANKIHGTGNNFVEIPDYNARYKYWSTLFKLKGRLSDSNNVAVQVNVKPILGGNTKDVSESNSNGEASKS